MKKNLFLAGMVAAALASCSNNDMDGGLTAQSGASQEGAVNFGAYMASSVSGKGTVITAESITKATTGKGFGVFAFYQPASNGVAGHDFTCSKYPIPDFMYNQKVTSSDGGTTWSYTPIKYWPNNLNDKITFFAYAPYVESTAWEDLGVSTDATGSKVSRTFAINNAIKDQVDYLWSDPVKNKKKPDNTISTVQFTFDHVTSKLNLYVGVQTPDSIHKASSTVSGNAWTDDNTTITIKSITFNNLAQSYKWSKDGVADATFEAIGSQNITATPYENKDSFIVVNTTNGNIVNGVEYVTDTASLTVPKFITSATTYTYDSGTYTSAAGSDYDDETKYYKVIATAASGTFDKEKTYYTKGSGSTETYTVVANPKASELKNYFELTDSATVALSQLDATTLYTKGVNYGYIAADRWEAGWHRFLQSKNCKSLQTSSDDPTIGTSEDDQYMFVAPQEFGDDQTVVVTYVVETKDGSNVQGTNDSKITNTVKIKMSEFISAKKFEMKKQYNLYFLIGIQKVKFSATVNRWTDGAEEYVDTPAANDWGVADAE